MDQGYDSLSSNYLANVDKYRLRSVNNEGDNSSCCDIEHTELEIGKPLREKTRRPAQHTTTAPNLTAFKTHCGVDT